MDCVDNEFSIGRSLSSSVMAYPCAPYSRVISSQQYFTKQGYKNNTLHKSLIDIKYCYSEWFIYMLVFSKITP